MDIREEFEIASADMAWFVAGGQDEYYSAEGYVYHDYTTDMCWSMWFESRSSLVVKLPDSYRSAGSKFELLNKQHMIDALTELGIRTK